MKRGDSRKNALPGEESLAQLLQEAASIQFTMLTYDQMSAREYGRIRAEMRQQGITFPPVDTLIAAIERVHDLIVLTSDSDFSRVPHLKVDNWLNSS